jgi:ADP-heptose:LPS heptosyltransferase
MDALMKRPNEDLVTLTSYQWLQKAFKLPIRELARRIISISTSLPLNLLKILKFNQIAAKSGKSIHLVILSGRIGDIISAEPSLDYIKRKNDYIIWLCRKNFFETVKYNPNIDFVLPISSYTETILLRALTPKLKWTNLEVDGALCNMFGLRVNNKNKAEINITNYYDYPLCDTYCLISSGKLATRQPNLYIPQNFDTSIYLSKNFKAPRNPLIILHLTSEEAARSWNKAEAKLLLDWLVQNTNFNIIEVGLNPLLPENPRTIQPRNKLTLGQQMSLVGKASFFIGVDSGFTNIANAQKIPTILLIGVYRHFIEQNPCRMNKHDIIIRSNAQTISITSTQVISAIQQMDNHLNLIFN